MKHLHVLLTEELYKAIEKYRKKYNISQGRTVRHIVRQWDKGPKEAPPEED